MLKLALAGSKICRALPSLAMWALVACSVAASHDAAAWTRINVGSSSRPLYIYWANAATRAIPYYIDDAGSDDITDGSDIQKVKDSVAAWTDLPCAALRAEYKGTTNGNSAGYDNRNKFYWIESNWPSDLGSQVIGVTTPIPLNNGAIVDADIRYNGVNYQWTTTGARNRMDVANIATHEIGHFFGLDHEPSIFEATMYPAGGLGETIRATPHPDDILGMCAIYPKESGAFGSPCTTDADCTDGRLCGEHKAVKVCSEPCTSNGNCPRGFSCVAQASGGSACVEPASGSTGGGGTGAANGDLCASCQDGSQCESGLCVSTGRGGGGFCTQPCPCPTNYQCVPTQGGESVCVPSTGQCSATGSSGAGLGEPCSSSGCESPYVCAGSSDADAVCRQSCNPSTQDCPDGGTCFAVSGAPGVLGVCVGGGTGDDGASDTTGGPTDPTGGPGGAGDDDDDNGGGNAGGNDDGSSFDLCIQNSDCPEGEVCDLTQLQCISDQSRDAPNNPRCNNGIPCPTGEVCNKQQDQCLPDINGANTDGSVTFDDGGSDTSDDDKSLSDLLDEGCSTQPTTTSSALSLAFALLAMAGLFRRRRP